MIRRLARCVREYKWATLASPLCMIGEVYMEVQIPLVLARIVDLGVTRGDMGAVVKYGLILVLCAMVSLGLCRRLRRHRLCQEFAPRYVLSGANL